MRTAILGVLFLALSSLVIFSSDDQLQRWSGELREAAIRFAYQKEVEISGLSRVTTADLSPLIPMEKPVSWWLANRAEVGASISRHPLVQRVSVRRCSSLSVRCFMIDVVERQVALLARNADDNKIWAVGYDGAFLAPVPDAGGAGIELFGKRFPQSPIVEGLFAGNTSADLIRARVRYIRSTMTTIEEELALHVREATLTPQGELKLSFYEAPYVVTFDNADRNPEVLDEEVRRLEAVVREVGAHASRVKSIDLAFNKMAVVEVEGVLPLQAKASPKLERLAKR